MSDKIILTFIKTNTMCFKKNDEIFIISTKEKKIVEETEFIDGIQIIYTKDNYSFASSEVLPLISVQVENFHEIFKQSTYFAVQREKTLEAFRVWVLETERFYKETFEKKKKKFWFF